jgi:cell division protease FtsH
MNRKNVIRTIVAVAVVLLLGFFLFYLGDDTRDYAPVDTSVAVSQINSDNVNSAQIDDREQRLRLDLKNGNGGTEGKTQILTNYPAGYGVDLFNALTAKNIKTNTMVTEAGLFTQLLPFLLPLLLLVGLFVMFSRMQTGGRMGFGFGKSKAKQLNKDLPKTTFADVAGVDEAVEELYEIKDFLQNPSRYQALGAKIPKGVLLYGPPGTGKTLLARAVAGEAGVPFFTISGSDFVEMFVGVGASRVRDMFEQAKQNSPCIIFVDEIDAVGRQRGAGLGGGHDEREQTLNQLLVEMDGFGGDAGVVVMGATNRPDILDPALLRPGRFDRQVVADVPDVFGRIEILTLHSKGRTLAPDADLSEIARLTPGFSGAELANVINEGALLTVREGNTEIDQATLEEAIDRVISGPAKLHILSEEARWTIAVHEASHAVVVRSVGQVIAAQKLSIVARGRQLGTSAEMLHDKDAVIRTEPDLHRQLTATMAGVAGEVLEFGYVSSTIGDDLHAATKLARSMVTSLGMSERLGRVTIGEPGGEVFLGASLQDMGSIGPHTLDLIDDETERLVARAEARAAVILQANWHTVRETAEVLVERETLSGVALDAVLSTVKEMNLEEIDVPQDPRPSERT